VCSVLTTTCLLCLDCNPDCLALISSQILRVRTLVLKYLEHPWVPTGHPRRFTCVRSRLSILSIWKRCLGQLATELQHCLLRTMDSIVLICLILNC